MAKRKSKRKPKAKSRTPKTNRRSKNKVEDIIYLEYEITEEPLLHPSYCRLPEPVKDRLEALHYDAQSKRAREAIEELLVLKSQHPNVPVIYNYLASAYAFTGETDKAKEITVECLQIDPDYLFARLLLMEFCLREKRYDEMPAMVDHKFDLKLLYPKRKKFHISEYTNFMGIIGLYFAKIGEHDRAQYYLESLKQIAPKERVTKMLNRELHPNFLRRFLKGQAIKASNRLIDEE